MGSLRVAQEIWKDTTIAAGDESEAAFVGTATNVVLMIELNSGTSAIVEVQVANTGAGLAAGRNAVPSADADWYALLERDLSGPVRFTIDATNPRVAFDMSPLAAPYLRLACITPTGSPNVTAYVQAIGD